MFGKTNMPIFWIYNIEEEEIMKLKYAFEYVDMENNEIIAVPVGKTANELNGVVKLNRSGKELMEMLEEETSVEEIIDRLSKKYENKQETIIEYVNETIEELRKCNLIIE